MKTNSLSQLPIGWNIEPTKYVFSVVNGATPSSSEESYWEGDICWATPEDVGALQGKVLRDTRRRITRDGYDNSGTQIAPKGSIVLTTRAPVGNLALAGIPLCTNQGCKTLVPKSELFDSHYFYYQFFSRKEELRALAPGTTFQELGSADLRAFELWFPPLPEQRAIADYLDRETAKIDALITEKERLLSLLAEKRRVLITQAVTRGLNPDVPTRDSGVEWLGEIPGHWELKRLKFISPEITVGIVVTPAKYYEDSGVPCLRSLNVKETGLTNTDLVYISPESNELLSKSKVFMGDLVAVRSGQPGTTAIVDERFDRANCIDLIIIRRASSFDSYFLAYFLNSEAAIIQFSEGSEGAIQQHFNIETAKDLLIPLPPLLEQRKIVSMIAAEAAKLGSLKQAAKRTINLLHERRAALISAAVTGQIRLGAKS